MKRACHNHQIWSLEFNRGIPDFSGESVIVHAVLELSLAQSPSAPAAQL